MSLKLNFLTRTIPTKTDMSRLFYLLKFLLLYFLKNSSLVQTPPLFEAYILISNILLSVCNVRPLTSAFGNQGIVHISISFCNEKMWMRQSDICLCRNPKRSMLDCNACKTFPSRERGPKRSKI